MEQGEPRRVECIVPSQLGDLADVAAQPVRVSHPLKRLPKGASDRLLDLSLLEADAELAAEQLGEVARFVGPERGQRVAYDLSARGGSGGACQCREPCLDPCQR